MSDWNDIHGLITELWPAVKLGLILLGALVLVVGTCIIVAVQ